MVSFYQFKWPRESWDRQIDIIAKSVNNNTDIQKIIMDIAGLKKYMIGEYLLFSLAGAIVMDLFFGEPSNSLHPVAWIGKLIEFFIPKLKEHAIILQKRKER